MANETTSTTVATNKLSYMLPSRVMPANAASIVAIQLFNDVDIAGQPTSTLQLPVLSDLAAAAAGTEGTAISTNTELGYGSAIQGTPVEGALIMSTITDRSIEVAFPGIGGAEGLLMRGSFEQQMAAVMPQITRMAGACLEKKETDGLALVTGLSNSVGTSGVDLTLDDIFAAIYTYDTLEGVNGDNVWLLAPNQVDELRRAIALAGGGMGGSVWTNLDSSFISARNLPTNGLAGGLMGRPVYQYAHSLRVLSDTAANVNGALIARGVGHPTEGGQIGAFGFVRNGGLKVRLQYEAKERGIVAVVSLEYAAIELKDAHGVRIRSDAP